jgi:hypothetical protein
MTRLENGLMVKNQGLAQAYRVQVVELLHDSNEEALVFSWLLATK